MRETSTGLGITQFVFTAFFVCILVWLALGVGTVALVVWIVFHVVTTTYRAPAAVPAGADGQATSTRSRETTNGLALGAAGLAVAGCVPILLGQASWFAAVCSAVAAVVAFWALRRNAPISLVTSYAMVGTLLLGVVVAAISLINLWANAPATLYGTNWGENRGDVATIAEYQSNLPCLGEAVSPAKSDQGVYDIALTGFVATSSCMVASGEGVRTAVFVQAETLDDLDDLFASGIITVGKLDTSAMWVERDGTVAVITADESSADVSQSAGATWISLDEDEPGR